MYRADTVGRFQGKDDSCDRTLVIYIEFFIYACRIQRTGNIIFYVPERFFMYITVSACFLIRFALQYIFFAPAHAQMRKKKRKVGGFSDSGFKTRCPWHFGHSFASFDVSEKTKTDS